MIKKGYLTILLLGALLIFLPKVITAADQTDPPPQTSPSTSVSPTPMPQNPAPPLGLTPCGKTMCLANETCVQYPQDNDQHCVPTELLPRIQAVPPQELPEGEDLCPEGTGVFPPNSSCTNNMKSTQEKITEYDRTCIYQPVVKYEGERWSEPDSPGNKGKPAYETQAYTMCGNTPEAGPGNAPKPPGRPDKYDCAVNMLVYTDVRDAELGSYGPSTEMRDKNSEEYKSSDFIAQNYLYDSLFGKSLDLTNNNRESNRTYWRLLSSNTQANLRSFILNMVNEDKMNDIKFKYVNTMGKESDTSTKELYEKLKKQVILFWHWPFIRIGCLTDYPVCPEFAQAISELKPDLQSASEKISQNPFLSGTMRIAVESYQSVATLLGADVHDMYAAFVPLDFDSVRSYILRKKTGEEQDMYDWTPAHTSMLVNNPNRGRYGTNKPALTNVSRENIPYLGAIEQGLLSPKFGILNSIQPSWVTTKYATDEGSTISNYRFGNKPEDFPEVKIAKQNLLSFLQEKANLNPLSIITNTALWIYEQSKDLFADNKESTLKGYKEPDVDLLIEEIRYAYVNYKDCPLPLSYHLLSPKTNSQDSPIPPGDPKHSDHHQIVTIWGPQVGWSFAPIRDVQCGGVNGSRRPIGKNPNKNPLPDEGDICICQRWKDDEDTYPDPGGDPCINYTRHWAVYGTEDGKALTVFNNPKAMDIKKAIVQDKSFALYNTLIPDEFSKKTLPDASVDAPYAANYNAFKGAVEENQMDDLSGCTTLEGAATAPNGKSCVLNRVEPINRINNNAQDTAHLLQNCWTVPEGLQNSPRCKYETVEATSSSGMCNGEAFSKIVGVNDTAKPGAKAQSLFSQVGNLSEDLLVAYAEAELQTGVPCEVLAGIHYREGSNNPEQDLQSGAPLNGRSLTESAIQAAQELLSKAGGVINDVDTLIKALSYYNGGGNANCQPTVSCPAIKNGRCGSKVACDNLPAVSVSIEETKKFCTCGIEAGSCRSICNNGYPFEIPTSPGLCPPPSIGYDDPYVVELWKPQHETMYVLYTYDCTQTPPVNQNRLGTFTFALEYYLEKSSKNASSSKVGSGNELQQK